MQGMFTKTGKAGCIRIYSGVNNANHAICQSAELRGAQTKSSNEK